METLANMLTTLFPAFAFLGIVLFACDRQDKRKIELEKVKAKAEWDRASECFKDDVTQEGFEEIVAAAGQSVKDSSPFPGWAQGLRDRRFAQRHQFVEVRNRLRLQGSPHERLHCDEL